MAVRIVSLTAKLGLDGTAFQQGIGKAQGQMRSFASNIKGQMAGAFSAVMIGAQMKAIAQYGGQLTDLSKKVGVSTTALQEFEHAAKLSGAGLEDVGAAMRGLAKARADALGGNEDKLNAFGAFGIDEASLNAQSLETTFRRIAEAVRTIDFGQDELPLVEATLGRTGAVLIPMFKEGLEAAGEEARRLGIILDQSVVASLDRASDEMDRLAARSKQPMAELTANLATFAGALVNELDRSFGAFGAWLGGLVHTSGGIKEKLAGALDAEKAHMAGIAERQKEADAVVREKREAPVRAQSRAEEEAKWSKIEKEFNKRFEEENKRLRPTGRLPAVPSGFASSAKDIMGKDEKVGQIERHTARAENLLEAILQESRRRRAGSGGPFGSD